MAMYFRSPFATAGDRAAVPNDVQPDGSVSWEQGYGIDYSLDPSTNPDALQVERTKWNEIIYELSLALQQYQQTGVPDFITSSDNGGSPFEYTKYALVRFDLGLGAGVQVFQSLVDANDADPSDDTKWALFPLGATNNFVFVGPATTGSANTQAVDVSPNGFDLENGNVIICTWGFSNTAGLTLNPDALGGITVKKNTATGLVALEGGEAVAGNTGLLAYNADQSCLVLLNPVLNVRRRLTTTTTFYVNASTGNNNNAGTSGAPWATLQYAFDYILGNIDIAGKGCVIQAADGTYAKFALAAPFVGGVPSLIGNTITPANVIIAATSDNAIALVLGAVLSSSGGFKVQTTTGGHGIYVTDGARMDIQGPVNFGPCAGGHMVAAGGGEILMLSNYTISGSALYHLYTFLSGLISGQGTVTVSGTPAFSGAFARAERQSTIDASGLVFSGSATGKRYEALSLGFINTAGGGANFFPGNSAGTGTNPGASPYGLYL